MLAGQLILPGRIEVRHVPDLAPPLPPGSVLLRIGKAGVCGSDIHLFREGRIGELLARMPMTIGHEAMGVVEAVAEDVDGALLGKRVAIEPTLSCGRCECCLRGDPNLCTEYQFVGLPPHPGVMQERLIHPAALVEPLPDSVSDEQAVMLEPLAIALWGVDLGHVKLGQSAAVLGCGVLGGLTLMLLARMGCRPLIATDKLDYRLDLVRELGATHVINAGKANVGDEVASITGRRGCDLVFEAAGAETTPDDMVRIAAPGGRCVVIGITDSDRFAFTHGLARRKGLTICLLRRSRLTLPRAIDLVAYGKLPVEKLVTHRFPLRDVHAAFELVANYRDGVIKAMIAP